MAPCSEQDSLKHVLTARIMTDVCSGCKTPEFVRSSSTEHRIDMARRVSRRGAAVVVVLACVSALVGGTPAAKAQSLVHSSRRYAYRILMRHPADSDAAMECNVAHYVFRGACMLFEGSAYLCKD